MDSCDLGYVYRTELPDGRILRLPYRIALKQTAYSAACIFHDEAPLPAVKGSHLCADCAEGLRKSVADIAESWSDLEDAMLPSGRAASSEPVSGTGDLYPPLPINIEVADVRQSVRSIVWCIVGQLILDLPDRKLPADQSAGVLASWLLNWHIGYLISHPSASHLRAVSIDLGAAAWDARGVIYRSKAVEVQVKSAHCHQLTKNAAGKTVRCPGEVTAVDHGDGRKVVQCSVDITHRVAADQWFHSHAHRAARPARTLNTLKKKYMKARTT